MPDYPRSAHAVPQRKPLPPQNAGAAAMAPLTQIVPDSHQPPPGHVAASHNRTRTSSSNIFPHVAPHAPSHAAPHAPSHAAPHAPSHAAPHAPSHAAPHAPSHAAPHVAPHITPSSTFSSAHQSSSPSSYASMISQYKPARRTLSNATASTSTTGTGGGGAAVRTASNASESLRRSGSARSSNNPGGYVALMRKQKATVWCDRAQHEDPRITAQQKAAKMRAAREVVGGAGATSNTSSAASGSMRSKIRHHAKPTTMGYTPASLVGGVGGVPMRLSASEVGDEAKRSDSESPRSNNPHRRSGSGVNSFGATPRTPSSNLRTMNSQTSGDRNSRADTLQTTVSDPPEGFAEVADGPHPANGVRPGLAHTTHQSSGGYSGQSTSSGEREASFGNVDTMSQATRPTPPTREMTVKNPDELRRRGSVDDRTMTMSAGRLFVANPDLSD